MKESPASTSEIRGILLDIEGTITPISFVHETLFPYARARTGSFLATHGDAAEVVPDIQMLQDENAADKTQGAPPVTVGPREARIESLTRYVHWLIDHDRKSTGLKSLQGKIWKEGYLDGSLRAPLFVDVLPALERWKRLGLTVAIFSSGSVLAQQLLMAHTQAGNVTQFIDGYFDTNTGPKTAGDSYRAIAAALRLRTSNLLFISDVVNELDAAAMAGIQAFLCIRPGNPPQPSAGRYQVITAFDQVLE